MPFKEQVSGLVFGLICRFIKKFNNSRLQQLVVQRRRDQGNFVTGLNFVTGRNVNI